MQETSIPEQAAKPTDAPMADGRLYVVMLSVHGLVRGEQIELGRDADTGGQVQYVVDLARALSAHPDVERVDLFTRQIFDRKVDPVYAEPEERLAECAWLIRVPFGPRRYLRKEVLWPYLDELVDGVLAHLRRIDRFPDLVHGHYADGGLAASRLAALLGVPMGFTGHSLGRVKRQRLQARGLDVRVIEERYNISTRIEAEETALDAAKILVASTAQEIKEQYGLYSNFRAKHARVIPPGVDLAHFRPLRRFEGRAPIEDEIGRFLRDPRLPMVLALSRADERKNVPGLVRAFGQHPELRRRANLVLFLGNRDDIRAMDDEPARVLTDVLHEVDSQDLYGSVALPRAHRRDEVPDVYRAAARSYGVFVNPALTEPFGLTLLEAAASGLPVVATNDGGPKEILSHCHNGVLVDPLETAAMGDAIMDALSDRGRWKTWSRSGVRNASRAYTWAGHVQQYVSRIHAVQKKWKRTIRALRPVRLPRLKRLVIADLDGTLLGDRDGLRALLGRLDGAPMPTGLGVATGRTLASARKVLKEWGVPEPDVWITSVGAEIHYGARLVADDVWERHLDWRWDRDAVLAAMGELPWLVEQPASEQRRFKVSFNATGGEAPDRRRIVLHLRERGIRAHVIASHSRHVDVLPLRASKGTAVRYVMVKWGLDPDQVLVAGDSGNDEDMLRLNTWAAVVGNHDPELESLRGAPRVHFAQACNAAGILETVEITKFLEPRPLGKREET